jgi:hypothetical protein
MQEDTMATTFECTVQPVPFGVSASYPPRSGNFVRYPDPPELFIYLIFAFRFY